MLRRFALHQTKCILAILLLLGVFYCSCLLVAAKDSSQADNMTGPSARFELERARLSASEIALTNQIAQIEASLKKARNSKELFFKQAFLLHKLGRKEDALKSYKQAIAAGDTSGELRYGYAVCLFESGLLKEAIDELERLKVEYSYDSDVKALLGRSYLMIGDKDKAVALGRQALFLGHYSYLTLQLAAEISALQGNFKDCWAYIVSMLESEPKNAYAYLFASHLIGIGEGSPAQAALILSKAKTFGPSDGDLFYTLARDFNRRQWLIKPGVYSGNAKDWQTLELEAMLKASSLDPTNLKYAAIISRLYFDRHNYDQAEVYLKRCCQLDAASPVVLELKKRQAQTENDLAYSFKKWLNKTFFKF